jgi:hypothetical protein
MFITAPFILCVPVNVVPKFNIPEFVILPDDVMDPVVNVFVPFVKLPLDVIPDELIVLHVKLPP